MNDTLCDHIQTIFKENNGYANTSDLTSSGVHTAHIKRLEEEGHIVKIKRGLYRWADDDMDHDQERLDVSKIVPGGVICLLSALSYYDLTTYQPWEHYVAIHRDAAKIQLPDYPPIKLIYFSEAQYALGVVAVNISGHQVKIYDMEKTLCDCARYQNKIGMDIVKESFKTYLRRNSKNIEKLIDYAQKTRVKSVVSNYVEVLL